ncbi:hypothetical protein OJ334_005007, partial [Salmonella enterica]|nr:hypothetical protein [Salmonella enterica]
MRQLKTGRSHTLSFTVGIPTVSFRGQTVFVVMFYYRHPAVVCVIHIGGHSVFPCSRCSRTFTSPSALVRHMR